jgi:transposase
MRFAGIDVAAERHVVAMVDETGRVLCKPSAFGENAAGYALLFELLGPRRVVWWRLKQPGITGAIFSSH